jgi:pyrophosphate--fructose-6-phosphate 1-phosphotransferase
MKLEIRKGKEKPVIQKTLVDLEGKPFAAFKQQWEQWKLEDEYLYPGPVQFFGDPRLTERVPATLLLEAKT